MGFFEIFQDGKELYGKDSEINTTCRTAGMTGYVGTMKLLKPLYLFINT